MKVITTLTLLSSLFATSALAAEAIITVTTNIDPTLELRNADGSLLAPNQTMGYTPGVGLDGINLPTRIFTNDTTKAISMRLQAAPQMVHLSNTAAAPIDLKVSFNNIELKTTDTEFSAESLYSNATGTGSSAILPLKIEQKNHTTINTSGTYQGMVQLVMAQKTAP